MQELIPDAEPEAMKKWLSYAQELDQDGTYSARDLFDEIYTEFVLVKQQDGDAITRQLFDAGRSFVFNPFEIRKAGKFLKEGMTVEAVCQKALNGFCDRTARESLESRNMLDTLRSSSVEQNDSLGQDQNMVFDKKMKMFSSEQARLVREIVNNIVLDAVKGADTDEEDEEDEKYLYCEIDYNIINRYMSPLYDMGVNLTFEKLSEFIDLHPAVEYSDFHNTGITVYLNSPEILQALGLFPTNGYEDLER